MQVVIIAFIRVASVLTNLLDQHELVWGQVSLVLQHADFRRADIFGQIECILAVGSRTVLLPHPVNSKLTIFLDCCGQCSGSS